MATHTIFDDTERYQLERLLGEPFPPDEMLAHIYRARNLDEFYVHDRSFNAPFILSPSHVKFVYVNPLITLWRGMGRSGGYNLGISIIGFSLPSHDEYIRIGLYQMIDNYQFSSWEHKFLGVLKDYVRFVDYRPDNIAATEYKRRYSFSQDDRSKFYFEGFGDSAIPFLFNEPRET